jgi:hypothetical protein
MKIFGLVLGLFAIFAVAVFVDYISFTNDANKFENGIKAQYSDNQNVYDNGWKEVKEKAQVPEMYTEQLKELYDGTMKGRYGSEGSRAILQLIKEQNPDLKPEIFLAIQQSIESFRRRFTQAQTELVSRKQEYTNFLTANTSSRFYNMFAGYPRIDMTKFDIVTSERTEETFRTKKADEIRLK